MRLAGCFIMAIFRCLVFLCLLSSVTASRSCLYRHDKKRLENCLGHWKYHHMYKNQASRFLTDISLTREICERGSIQNVDECIANTVSPGCGTMHRFWEGIRDKFVFICDNYYEFSFSHEKCRTNFKLSIKLENCVYDNYQRISQKRKSFCESSTMLLQCVAEAFISQCSRKATDFFLRMFDAGLAPEMEHLECPKETVKMLQTETPAPTEAPCLLDVHGSSLCGGASYEAITSSSTDTKQRHTAMLSFFAITVLNFICL